MVIAIVVAVPSLPNWLADVLWALAAIPALWLLGRLLRWRLYALVLTTTRILVRRGVFDRDIVQIRLQRITELNLSQKLWERVLATGRLIIDVQGEDDAVVLQFVRKPAIVQRVINGQINELVGGGTAEPIPAELRQIDVRSQARGSKPTSRDLRRRPSAFRRWRLTTTSDTPGRIPHLRRRGPTTAPRPPPAVAGARRNQGQAH